MAYGYHSDNPPWITEDQPLCGNPVFAYADHKRQAEAMLTGFRSRHPGLAQTVLRIGTILGKWATDWPAGVLKTALAVGSALGVSRYGTEPLDFLLYRPVLLHTALKGRFGYVPRKTSGEAFDAFVAVRAAQGRPVTAASSSP